MKNNNTMHTKPTFVQRYSAIIKMAMIGLLVILLLIPSFLVQDLIRERQQNQRNVKQEISSKWGTAQTITGPVISIPYEIWLNANNPKTRRKTTQYFHILPDELAYSGKIDTSLLKRSIYEVIAYSSDLTLNGKFNVGVLNNLPSVPDNLQWENAILQLGISDLTGVKEQLNVRWNNTKIPFNPGIETKDIISTGVSSKISLSPEQSVSFEIELSLKGSESLSFYPVGKETTISLRSACPNPNFFGNFLPTQREVTAAGFDANWKVLHLNRNYPQAWSGGTQNIHNSSFGVELLVSVDPYLKTMRCAKYAILFIAMTFLTFFFIEILGNKKIHPIQYILIGLVLIMFYVLLLSLSEQLGFNAAYLIASSAVVLLIGIYTASALRNKMQSAITVSILAVLYGFIYVIIQLAEYSLLFGSIGLFIFLASVMLASRKVDWYKIGLKEKE